MIEYKNMPRFLQKTFDWLTIAALVAVPVSCSYWLHEDDKRMYKVFMQNCRELQIERDEVIDKEKCAIKWYKVYRETFGRNP